MMRPCSIAAVISLALATGALAADEGFVSLFNGKSASGWKTNTGKAVPADNVQADGLNPHKAGGYLVVHEKPRGDFILEFEYKLSKGCNSGVFVRVGDLKEPVTTGIEVAIDDTTGRGRHDSGAFYDLIAPRVNAQKPQGEWNLMSIAAKGPIIEIVLNGESVNRINLDEWTEKGQRPDGSTHKFTGVTVKALPRSGFLGFQDHGADCWYRKVQIKDL